MKKTVLAALVATLGITAAPAAFAQLSFNVGAVTDYRYRGISQTRLKPAIQGGVDYADKSGFYVGAWASNIKWIKDFGGDANIEIDLYGGFKGELTKDVGFDVGVLTYQYPSNKLNPSANTTELYGALTYGPVTAKYSHAVTDTFGNFDSKNSWYLDLTGTFEVAKGTNVIAHVGHQKISGPLSSVATYTDYSLGVTYDLSGVLLGLTVIGTDADKVFYSSPVNGKELGKAGVVLSAKYTF
ncbi:MAG: hypothetical protein RL341_2280 [Pseudomonadota bacterium]|jgi:uncharacterized protein (TIGR02001 family)